MRSWSLDTVSQNSKVPTSNCLTNHYVMRGFKSHFQPHTNLFCLQVPTARCILDDKPTIVVHRPDPLCGRRHSLEPSRMERSCQQRRGSDIYSSVSPMINGSNMAPVTPQYQSIRPGGGMPGRQWETVTPCYGMTKIYEGRVGGVGGTLGMEGRDGLYRGEIMHSLPPPPPHSTIEYTSQQ